MLFVEVLLQSPLLIVCFFQTHQKLGNTDGTFSDENSGPTVKKLAFSQFNVEAARILSDWSSKEEYNNVILKEIGIDTILYLTTTEPSGLLQPIVGDILSRLLEKGLLLPDLFKHLTLI